MTVLDNSARTGGAMPPDDASGRAAPGGLGRLGRLGRLGALGRRGSLRRWKLAVPAFAAGTLVYLAFPPVGAWLLAPVGVAGLTLLVRGRRLRASYGLGMMFGLGFLLPMLRFTSFVGLDAWIALSIAEAAIFAIFAPVMTVVMRLRGWPLWVAATWVAQEALRGREPFGGFPWGRLAFIGSGSPFTPLAAVGGAPLVTAAIALAGTLLAAIVVRVVAAMRGDGPVPWARLGGLTAGVVATLLAGLAVPLPVNAEAGYRTVAAIQGNVSEAGGLAALGRARQVTGNHLAATERLAAKVRAGTAPQPDLVFWPENSSDLDPFVDPATAASLAEASRAIGRPILVGAVLDGPGVGHVRNAGLVWGPDGAVGPIYVKQHPVPFAEYLPGRSTLQKLVHRFAVDMPNDFVKGTSPGGLTVNGVRIGDVICFEVAYDGLVRDTVNTGATMLVIQTNNASFGRKGESQQQLAMSRLRAVEFGRTTVQVSTSGQSAIILPDGKVIAQSGLYESAELTGKVPLRTSRTLADRLGPGPEVALVAMALLALAGGIVAGRRSGGGDGAGRDGASGDGASGDGDEGRGRVDGKRVLVCIPTYNERENLPETVGRLRAAVESADVLVLDDSSPDGTGDIADGMAADDEQIHVLHRPAKSGLGAAYVAGFSWALEHGYDVVVEMDADGSHQPEELPLLLDALTDADLVIGSRWVEGGEVHNWPRSRHWLSRGGNGYVRAVLGMPVADATAGFRAYRSAVLASRPLDEISSQGYCFQVDLAWRAWRDGFRIAEVPITFIERARGQSKMSRAIVGEALWRVTWWAVRSGRARPRTRPVPGPGGKQTPDIRV